MLDGEEPFTAVFCANDSLAQGAMEALASRGLRVPVDVSVTGFDDMPLASMLRPPLTTVHVPIVEMARRAVALGLDAPADGAVREPVVLGTELVIRESTGPVPDRRA